MTSVVPLGRLTKVPLRNAWPNEAANFTPWLAEEVNLAHLGETIGIQIELEGVEKQVGSFSADILAKNALSQQWIIIENQIAPTDHGHLGQLLTYAAGLDAHTIIWVAEAFRDEHRAAIDFLNRATTDDFSFFAVQIELWQIGTSVCAPKFSIVAQPNDWSKRAQSAKQPIEGELNPTQKVYKEFWSILIQKSKDRYPALSSRSPYKGGWQFAERLRSGDPDLASNASFSWDKSLRCEIYISGSLAKMAFRFLRERKSEIEGNFGEQLSWEELPDAQASRVAFYMPGMEKYTERARWDAQQEWLLKWWPRLTEAMRPIILTIKAETLQLASTEGASSEDPVD